MLINSIEGIYRVAKCERYGSGSKPHFFSLDSWRFHQLHNMFLDLRYFYEQVRDLPQLKYSKNRISKAELRLNRLLFHLNHLIQNEKVFFLEKLYSEDIKEIETAAFALSSLVDERYQDVFVDAVLNAFFRCDYAKLSAFQSGLSRGYHPRLTEKLINLQQSLSFQKRILCKEIIDFRISKSDVS